MTTEPDTFQEWALLELMGHRRIAGLVSEQQLAGAPFVRIDVYQPLAPNPSVTQFYSPSSVYCITPITEEMAREFADTHLPQPIARYELAAPLAAEAEPDMEPGW